MYMGVFYMALSRIFTGVLSQLINAFPNKKLLDYPYLEQLKDMAPSILLSAAMGAGVYLLTFLGLNDFATLALQLACGVALYVALSLLFRIDSFNYILSVIKNILHRRGAGKE